MPTAPGTPLPRIPSGIPGLDQVTEGGLPAGEVTLLAGTTGTGKTLISSQFLAAGIMTYGEPGVFVTLGEAPAKLRRFMAAMGWDVAGWEAAGTWAFVDGSPSGDREVVVGEAFDFAPLLARVQAAVKRVGAHRVVLDSISNILSRLGETPAIRSHLYRLVAGFEALGVTTIVTAERTHEYDGVARLGVEEYVADNIIILRNVLFRERRRRTIEPLKFRGAAHRQGESPFVILPGEGAVVLALSNLALAHPSTSQRVSLGNTDLDAMCGGGAFQDSIILVTGPTGSGKTLLCLEFVESAAAGERSLLVAFEESEAQLSRNARNWGHDLDALQAAGRLEILCQYPESAPLESHLLAIQRVVDAFKPTRVAVDSLSGVARGATIRDFHEFLLGLTWLLKSRGITGLFTTTTSSLTAEPSATGLESSTLLDMIILMRYVEVYGELHRAIAVLKMRGSPHEKTFRELVIDATGTHVGEAFRTTTGILSGTALELLGEERARILAKFGGEPAPAHPPGPLPPPHPQP